MIVGLRYAVVVRLRIHDEEAVRLQGLHLQCRQQRLEVALCVQNRDNQSDIC